MISKTAKVRVLDELQKVLGVPDDDLEKMPASLVGFLKLATERPTILTIDCRLSTGSIEQVLLSEVPRTSDAYLAVSQVLNTVAQRFSKMAAEAAKTVEVVEEEEVKEG